MKRFSQLMAALPKSVRGRALSAMLLMAGFPILGATLVMCDRLQQRTFGMPVVCIVMGLCTLLAWFGFWDIRTLLLSVIDIRDFTDEIIRLHRKADGKGGNAAEVAKLERLICYLQDQMDAAQQIVQYHLAANREYAARSTTTYGSKGTLIVHLPSLIPRSALAARIQADLAKADEQHCDVCIVKCQSRMVSAAETADDTLVPAWLRDLLSSLKCPVRFLGRVQAGHWIGVLECMDRGQIQEIAGHIHAWAGDPTNKGICAHACHYPIERFNAAFEIPPPTPAPRPVRVPDAASGLRFEGGRAVPAQEMALHTGSDVQSRQTINVRENISMEVV